jgi:hypothetical protein
VLLEAAAAAVVRRQERRAQVVRAVARQETRQVVQAQPAQ